MCTPIIAIGPSGMAPVNLTVEPSSFVRDWWIPLLRRGTAGGVVVPTRSRPESRRPSVEV